MGRVRGSRGVTWPGKKEESMVGSPRMVGVGFHGACEGVRRGHVAWQRGGAHGRKHANGRGGVPWEVGGGPGGERV